MFRERFTAVSRFLHNKYQIAFSYIFVFLIVIAIGLWFIYFPAELEVHQDRVKLTYFTQCRSRTVWYSYYEIFFELWEFGFIIDCAVFVIVYSGFFHKICRYFFLDLFDISHSDWLQFLQLVSVCSLMSVVSEQVNILVNIKILQRNKPITLNLKSTGHNSKGLCGLNLNSVDLSLSDISVF